MKSKQTFGLIFAVSIFLMIPGCNTPPDPVEPPPPPRERPAPVIQPDPQSPLTLSLLRRLGESVDSLEGNIGRFRFVLTGKVVLEREYSKRNDTFKEGGIPDLEDEHIKEVVTINDQTEGQALTIRNEGNRTILSIGFEPDDAHWLVFSYRTGDSSNDFFYLDYTPIENPAGEEKGTMVYGEETFKVFTGDRPYLSVKLSQRDIDTLNARTAPGRRRN